MKTQTRIYKNAVRVKWPNKRVAVVDREDGKGFIIQFAKMNDDSEDGLFCSSANKRGIRYTGFSISTEALEAFVVGAVQILQRNQVKKS